MNCPKCHSSKFVKNGHTHYGKQRFRCQHCGRQFVNNPSRQPISQDKRDLIDKLLKERLALAAIARVAEVSERWLQDYVNQKYYLTPKEAKITEKKRGKLILEIDEMWSFVGSKRNKVWIWLAIDSLTCINCRCLCWRSRSRRRPKIMGFFTTSLPSMCNLLYRFLGSLSRNFTD
jgi:AraC-like DNA-binding protein